MGEYPVDTIHDAPPFRGFQLDDGQWGALDIAGWLHDGGKVTARGALLAGCHHETMGGSG
jgi:hypothetical protein